MIRRALKGSARGALDVWRKSTVVCFDVDSTVCREEGVDVLAEHCGAGEAVRAWTTKAMDGGVPFEEALAARLDLIRPSAQDVRDCLVQRPPQLTEGIEELVRALRKSKRDVYLVSGGFRQMIDPVANSLKIPFRNVVANTLLFGPDGSYAGFDASEPTSRSGGKAVALAKIREDRGGANAVVVMVGDGVTDMEARPPADLFIGFGGVVEREVVRNGADLFVTSFDELVASLKP